MDKAKAQEHIALLPNARANNELDIWIYEAASFCYEQGYNSASDVRMLISFATFRDIDEIVQLLQDED
jgi:hypothetical protein